MERAISPNEVKVVNWLLDHALIDVTAYRLQPLEQLCVEEGAPVAVPACTSNLRDR